MKNGELGPGEEHFPYRCDVCEKGLRSLAALKYHERIHSGETPFECQYCGRQFAVASHLSYHVRVHTGETAGLPLGNNSVNQEKNSRK